MVVLACVGMAVGVIGPAAAAADDVSILASPKCSGTASHGKIRYQVCVRYNCDSDSCYVQGYFGLINTATSARTVSWELEYVYDTYWNSDGSGQVTLAAGEQRTIYSPNIPREWDCDASTTERLRILYDSSGWSAPISVEDYMACT